MPITLPPLSRRTFLGATLASALSARGIAALAAAEADIKPDPHRFALLSDVHIHADRKNEYSHTIMWDTLAQAVGEIIALKPRPAAVLINGDCAHFYGKPEDYATFIDAVAPLRQAGMPVHIGMGNHDDRGNFLKALKPSEARVNDKEVADKLVSLIPAERANFFILDTLDVTARLQGTLGQPQLKWLSSALDARADKPAIVFIHHNPDARPADKRSGLDDTSDLFNILAPRKQVKALIFGHTHVWNYSKRDGIHLINLPPTAWLFQPALPRGWVDLNLEEKGATFELRSLDKGHYLHGEKVKVEWR